MKYGFSTLRVPKEATERDTVENTMKWNLKKKKCLVNPQEHRGHDPMFSNIGKQPKSSSVGPRQSNKLCLFRPGYYCTILDDAHLPKSAGDKLKEFQTN